MATLGSALGTLMDPTSGVPLKKTAQRTGMNEMLLRMLLPAAAGLGLGMAVKKGIGPIEKAFRARFGDQLEKMFSRANESEPLARMMSIRGIGIPSIDDVDFGSLSMAHNLFQQGLRREARRTLDSIENPMVSRGKARLLVHPEMEDMARYRADMAVNREIEMMPTIPEFSGSTANAFYDRAAPFIKKHGPYSEHDLAAPALGYNVRNVMNPDWQRWFAKSYTGSDSMPSLARLLEGLGAHEGSHAFTEGGDWLDDSVREGIRLAAAKSRKAQGGALDPLSEIYTTKPTETVAHIHQLRDMTRTKPGTNLLDTLKKLGRTPRANDAYKRLINAYNPESLDLLLRTVPVAAGAAAVPATAAYAYHHRES